MPDWESLDQESLKKYSYMGIALIFLGSFILVTFLPTIKIWFKLLGALISCYGLALLRTSNQYLKKNK